MFFYLKSVGVNYTIFQLKLNKMANTISNNLENPINRTMLPQTNLVCQIYYDLDWVNRKFAVEWWQNNGHFNDELYDKVLQEKLNRIKDPSPDVVFLNSNQIR